MHLSELLLGVSAHSRLFVYVLWISEGGPLAGF